MPPRNMKPLPGKMPNGQDRGEYTRKCHELINRHYKYLERRALSKTCRNPIWAQELLHDTLVLVLEGHHNIDFNKSPVQYIEIMLSHVKGRHKQIKQKDFNRTSMVAYDPRSHVIDRYVDQQEEDPENILLQNFDVLLDTLEGREKKIMRMRSEGVKLKDIAIHFNLSVTWVRALMKQSMDRMRKKGLILLQGD